MANTPGRKELTHERILDVAARTIRRAGHDGVGVADIMKQAGLTHGGFYAHFASRNALLVEALQHAGRVNTATLSEHLRQAQDEGLSPFSALVQTYLHDSQLDNVEQGCCVAALACEMPRQPDEVADTGRAQVLALVDLVQRSLRTGLGAGQAQVITATLVGSLQLARTLGGAAGQTWLAQTRQTLMQQYDAGRAG